MLGGTQSLHCNGRDEALALPTEESARIALRTQQIIASESGVANTVDPVAGSYAIETLTNEIERGAVELLARIEQRGGTLAAIETGFIQREIQESAYRAQLAIDSGESVVVGVNRFADKTRTARPADVLQIDPETERSKIERLRALRASRSASAWEAALEGVSRAARDGSNLVPPIIAAVEAKATVGEISDALRAFSANTRDGDGLRFKVRVPQVQVWTIASSCWTVEHLTTVFDLAVRSGAGGRRCELRDPRGRNARPGRRIGQRQIGHGVVDHAAGAAARTHPERPRTLQGTRPARAPRTRDAQDPRAPRSRSSSRSR